MDLIVFEQDRPFIVKALASGEFDCIEAANEVAEADFFREMFARKVIEQLAESYPTPRRRAGFGAGSGFRLATLSEAAAGFCAAARSPTGDREAGGGASANVGGPQRARSSGAIPPASPGCPCAPPPSV
jgi:hypothetical protein